MKRLVPAYALALQRFEIASVAVLTLVLVSMSLLVRGHLVGAGVSSECFAGWFAGRVDPISADACAAAANAFFRVEAGEAAPLAGALALAPYVIGGLLGVGVIARELESGTAAFVWSMSPSRVYWLAVRTIPVIAVVMVLAGIVALAAGAMTEARQPWAPDRVGFLAAGLTAPRMILASVLAFAAALTVGLILGRTLPSVIVATVLLAFAWLVPQVAMSTWLSGEALKHARTSPFDAYNTPGGTLFSSASRLADGTVISDWDAVALAPPGLDPADWLQQHATGVYVGVPGERFGDWSQLESAGLTVALAVSGTLAVLLTHQRRPR